MSKPELSPCWVWEGWKNEGGYGVCERGGKQILVHRFMCENFVQHIPDGLCALHRCDNASCVNPAHLFVGTFADNNRDRATKGRSGKHRKLKTHCKRGHEFIPENIYWHKPTQRQAARRGCKVCVKERATRFYATKKAA